MLIVAKKKLYKSLAAIFAFARRFGGCKSEAITGCETDAIIVQELHAITSRQAAIIGCPGRCYNRP